MSEYFDPANKKNQPILDYFENKSWLIIDTSSSIRTSIKKTITQLGSKMSNMIDVDNYKDAVNLINSNKPHFVIGNNKITGGSSIDLFEAHLKVVPNRINGGFFIMTDENSMAEVAIFLEYEMDGIIALPFTGATILNSLTCGVKSKLTRTPYLKALNDGRAQYLNGSIDKAQEFFNACLSLHSHPYEGHYYLGKIFNDKDLPTEAILSYEKSILCNPECYKSLKNLSSLYYQEKKYSNSYDTYLKMAEHYPTSPDKIPELIRLSIINQKYEDIVNYLTLFRSIKSPNVQVQIYISAGLAILGKYFVTTNDLEKSVEALTSAFFYSNGKYEILKSIVNSFEKLNKLKLIYGLMEAENLTSWAPESVGLHFHVFHSLSGDDQKVFAYGEKLIKQKVREVLVYKDLIERAIKMKKKAFYIENIVEEGIRNIPECREELEELLKNISYA